MKAAAAHLLSSAIAASLMACALASCSAPPRSMTLSLSLRPGMERTMRFVTEQRITGTARGGAASPLSSLSLTYAFRVISVDASGLSTVACVLRDAVVPRTDASTARAIDALKKQRMVATIDGNGRVIRVGSDGLPRFQVPGLPAEPGAGMRRDQPREDLTRLFSGFDGRTVSVGETWTSVMSGSPDAPVLKGTLQWTLASVTDTSARLSYAGALGAEGVRLAGPSAGGGTEITGTVAGYVSLERATGWPERGASVIRARVAPRNSTRARDGGGISLSVVTTFNEVP
jgi:hypothetical protein